MEKIVFVTLWFLNIIYWIFIYYFWQKLEYELKELFLADKITKVVIGGVFLVSSATFLFVLNSLILRAFQGGLQ
jgi:hypothetical protein